MMTNEQGNKGGGRLPLPGRKRSILKRWVVGSLILVSGMIIGSALTAYLGHDVMLATLGNPSLMAERFHKRLTRELSLSKAQEEEVRTLLMARGQEIHEVMGGVRPRLEEHFRLLHDEVGRVLTNEQKIKWDRRYEKMRKRFERFRISPRDPSLGTQSQRSP